jgi:hypothetical protein
MLRPSTCWADVKEIKWKSDNGDLLEFLEESVAFNENGEAHAKVMVSPQVIIDGLDMSPTTSFVYAEVVLNNDQSFFTFCPVNVFDGTF